MAFDVTARERLLAFLEAGWTLEAAAAAAGTSRTTVNRWAARGWHDPDGEAGEFAARFDALRATPPPPEPRTTEDLPPDPPRAYAERVWSWVLAGDPFVALSPDEMALLTPEQAEVARSVHADGPPSPQRVLDACAAEADELRESAC